MITVQAVINNVTKTFTLNNLSSVRGREDLGQGGVEDMTSGLKVDLNEASVLWNLRIRYDNGNIYTYIGERGTNYFTFCNILNSCLSLGSILVSVNPYRTLDPRHYDLDAVSRYYDAAAAPSSTDDPSSGPPPHIFAVGAAAYKNLVSRDGQNQVRPHKG